jgi:hypothetical protein
VCQDSERCAEILTRSLQPGSIYNLQVHSFMNKEAVTPQRNLLL